MGIEPQTGEFEKRSSWMGPAIREELIVEQVSTTWRLMDIISKPFKAVWEKIAKILLPDNEIPKMEWKWWDRY